MATYDDWNSAIADAFTKGIPLGAPVYLAIDDEELATIGAAAFGADAAGQDGWTEDFCVALRTKMTGAGAVQLSRVKTQHSTEEAPDCVAFLAALVLAASRMAEGADVSELNYFLRLREILDVAPEPGGQSKRPAGLTAGIEEPLWRTWNDWLGKRGFLATAARGPEGPRKYINYPLSQALLREADRQHLEDTFDKRAESIPLHCDPQTVAAIVGEPRWPTSHLREVMGQDGLRRAAAQDAVFEAYESWRARARSGGSGAKRGVRPLMAGLFREEDPIMGSVVYRLLPRMRRGGNTIARPTMEQDGQTHRLRPMREGWYEPTGCVGESALAGGARYPLMGLAGVDAVELPERAFWMLVPEPEDPESGLFAAWAPPRLGEPFILLTQESLWQDLQLLKDEGLVHWDGEPRPTLTGWLELHGFLAVSEAWDGVHTGNLQLFLELRPRGVLSISVSGGLRSPSGAWLEGFGPQVVVHGFEGSGDLLVSADTAAVPMQAIPFKVNQPVEGLIWERAGAFLVEAKTNDESSEARLVRIESWDGLTRRTPADPLAQAFGVSTIEGARVEAVRK